ncbi:DUF4258 domain-containing protein [Salicibibacter halophilus]|uniref:DUF4258 domain-containing protein n=1 Tax=Salicibibacter halophilus TaxID=2502791 RepID=UPI001D04AB32|nr:DUF4258 domain-containing protein [Salicibibacter halophilus]
MNGVATFVKRFCAIIGKTDFPQVGEDTGYFEYNTTKYSGRKWWFTNHALQKCDQRGIDIEKLVMSLVQSELVEDYPDDLRGHSCLILSFVDRKAVHTVCGLHENGTVFITVYYPDLPKWVDERTRRSRR